MASREFAGQIAVVTGGAQGIGGAVVDRLSAAGCRIAIWDQDGALAAEKATSLNNAQAFGIDIADPDAVTRAAAETIGALGTPTLLVNSAGIAGMNAPVEDYPVEEWRRIVDINLNGTFYVNKALVPGMKAEGFGRIVNIASVAGKEGNPNAAAYSASKAGVIGLTKSLGKELASLDIAVNCITPAAARTRIFDQMSQTHIDYMLSKIPRGRFVEVEEVAAMVMFLLSADNSFTTGGVFDLSGGRATY
ncbi:MAG: SDR family NAD(P)-dependent oxidoreductase [Pseudomonadota bacterium]